MINVVLDTNILYQEGLVSLRMLKLRQLIFAKHVKVFIPDLVLKEYLTHRVFESKNKLKSAKNNIVQLLKKDTLSDTKIHNQIIEVQQSIDAFHGRIEDELTKELEGWLEEFQISVLPFPQESITEVMDDYFCGTRVYKKPKSREDIPDAMINCTINKLVDEHGEVTVIVKDGTFKKHLETVDHIHVIESLELFLEETRNVEKFTQLHKHMMGILQNGLASTYFTSTLFEAALFDYIINSEEFMENLYFEDDDIIYTERLDIPIFGEVIEGALELDELKIINAELLAKNEFLVTWEFVGKSYINYCAGYSYYLDLLDIVELDVEMHSMNGEGICDLAHAVSSKISGSAIVKIDGKLDIDKIKLDSADLSSEDNPLSIELKSDEIEINFYNS